MAIRLTTRFLSCIRKIHMHIVHSFPFPTHIEYVFLVILSLSEWVKLSKRVELWSDELLNQYKEKHCQNLLDLLLQHASPG